MSKPQIWIMPDIPPHGTLVRSRSGEVWRRRPDDDWETNWDASASEALYGCVSWDELLLHEGPLTEVLDG